MHKLKIHRWSILILPILVFSNIDEGYAQNAIKDLGELPEVNGAYFDGVQQDYLVEKLAEEAAAFRNNKNNELILSNGLISRTFRLSPNAATTSLKILARTGQGSEA